MNKLFLIIESRNFYCDESWCSKYDPKTALNAPTIQILKRKPVRLIEFQPEPPKVNRETNYNVPPHTNHQKKKVPIPFKPLAPESMQQQHDITRGVALAPSIRFVHAACCSVSALCSGVARDEMGTS